MECILVCEVQQKMMYSSRLIALIGKSLFWGKQGLCCTSTNHLSSLLSVIMDKGLFSIVVVEYNYLNSYNKGSQLFLAVDVQQTEGVGAQFLGFRGPYYHHLQSLCCMSTKKKARSHP